jgi:drug/metabolite transporter (DMT)-like permease
VVDLEERRQLEHKKRIRIGYMMALFCAILWGLWYLPGNALWSLEPFSTMFGAVSATNGSTVALIVVAVLISGFNALTVIIALFIWNGGLGKYKEMYRTARQFKPCTKYYFFASIFGGPMAILGSFMAMGFVGAAFAAVAALFYPVVGSLLSYYWLGQKVSRRALLGILIIVFGSLAIYAGGLINDLTNGGGNAMGYVGGLMAAAGWGIEGAVAAKALDISEPDIGITLRFLGENIIWWIVVIPILFLLGFPMYDYAMQVFEPTVLLVLLMAGITFGFCYVAWYKSFPLIGVGRGQGIGNLYGIFAVIFIALFVGTIPDWTILLGGVMCIIGSLVMFTEGSIALESLRRDEPKAEAKKIEAAGEGK